MTQIRFLRSFFSQKSDRPPTIEYYTTSENKIKGFIVKYFEYCMLTIDIM